MKRLWRRMRDNAALITLVLFLVTIVLVSIGVSLKESESDRPGGALTGFELVSTVVYETGRVLTLNMDPRTNQNLWIGIGRIFAVLFVLFVGLQAVRMLLRESWATFRLAVYGLRGGHCIVCGLGRVGWPIVEQLLNEGRRVVVLERDPANEAVENARRAGAIVLVADATEEEILKRAHVAQAREIYFVTGTDEENIEATIDLRGMKEIPDTMRCFGHLVNPDLGDLLRDKLLTSRFELHTFNVSANSARQLIIEQLTPLRPMADEVALYVVIGSGTMARTVASNLAELAHFENQRRARLLLVAENAEAFADSILSRWGQFSPATIVADWEKIDFPPAADDWGNQFLRPRAAFEANDPRAIEYTCNAVFTPRPKSMRDRAFVAMLAKQLQKPGVKPVIIICEELDTENYSQGVILERTLRTFHGIQNVPIFAWLPRQEPLKMLLSDQSAPHSGVIRPFGSCLDELTLAKLRDPIEDRVGLVIKAYFETKYGGRIIDLSQPDGVEGARRIWNEQSEIDRHSNRMAAIHFQVKLRCLGMKLIPADGAPGEACPDDATMAELGEIEHNRWVAERLLAGVSFGERSNCPPRRLQLCTNAVMKTISGLEKENEKDVDQLRAIWAELNYLQLKVVRV